MEESSGNGLIDQLRNLLREGSDYLNSVLSLQQARFTSFALTAIIFTVQILFACVLGLAAFILFNVAIGIGLARLMGNSLYAVAILGTLYTILALLLSYKALLWLRKIKS